MEEEVVPVDAVRAAGGEGAPSDEAAEGRATALAGEAVWAAGGHEAAVPKLDPYTA